ncbi:hypothetical protein GCM10018987_19540 [Streptomyces cremeus]
MLQQVQAAADASGEIDWDVSVDSIIVRAHRPAAGPRVKGGRSPEHQTGTPWQSLVVRLMEVVWEVRALAARAAGSPPSST